MLDRSALHSALMGTDPRTGPVGTLTGIREGIATFDKGGDEFMAEMWMGTTMAASLGEAEMLMFTFIINTAGGEKLNRLRQTMRKIGALHFLRDLRLRFARQTCSSS